MLVDDVFPVTRHGTLAYSKAGRRQLWVPLVEKAAPVVAISLRKGNSDMDLLRLAPGDEWKAVFDRKIPLPWQGK